MSNNNNWLVIEFPTSNLRSEFRRAYSGNFYTHHPNYSGTFVDDMVLGSGTPLLHMERDKIVNFQRLVQDLFLYRGKIRVYE